MAMLPFCGYNMGDYFSHWLNIGRQMRNPPKIFAVNWFRTDDDGRFIWPGYGENIRVLKWIIERVNNGAKAKETPIGYIPHVTDLDLSWLSISDKNLAKLLEINPKDWGPELEDIEKFLRKINETFKGYLRGIDIEWSAATGSVSGSVAAVPEPSTTALFGGGLLLVLGFAWKRRTQAAA